jgi:membrane protein DedA with SNARE-associated domain/rhodanese-related sulfurtransferase
MSRVADKLFRVVETTNQMTETRQFLINHGAPIVFGAVFVEQIGLPLPALPWLLAAGALSASGEFNLLIGIAVTLIACLIADGIWFYLGRFRGNQVLNLLCRVSLEPDSCVRRTQNVFSRYGWRGIVIAKFVPGLSTVGPPLAGMSSMSAGRFLFFDGIGSVLYGGCLIGLGYFFSSQIQHIEDEFASVGARSLYLIGGVLAAYLGFKYWQRRRLLGELRMARITAAELRQMQESGQTVAVIDMRSSEELQSDPAIIEGAVHLSVEDVKQRRYTIQRDGEVVVYCSCPNEVTSARVALLLRRQGFTHVRPLLGGLDAWRELNYPLSTRSSPQSSQTIEEGVPHS